jgi:hypothetical protein
MRLSFIWSETFTQLFDSSLPNPLAFVGTDYRYQSEFTRLHNQQYQQKNMDDSIGFPWKPGSRHKHYFWGHYLKDKKGDDLVLLEDLNAPRSWKQLLPFRSTLNLPSVETNLPPLAKTSEVRISVEAFYYPFGLALVINAECCNEFTIVEVIDTALNLKKQDVFRIKSNNKCNSTAKASYNKFAGKALNLDDLAKLCLDTIRKENLGLATFPENGRRSSEPFTVFTPVQADNIDSNESIDNSEIHQMLEAVTTWRHPGARALSKLSDASFVFPDNSLIYHHKRGRAVWFPVPLTTASPPILRTLGCYHRNLVLTSLQVESLSRLLIIAAEDIENNKFSGITYTSLVRRAAANIRQLYGHTKATYASPSVEIQINDNGWVDSVNAVCNQLNFDPPNLESKSWSR